MEHEQDEDGRWHLDRKVPITLIVVLTVQMLGGAWFMSKLDSRVLALETAQLAQNKTDDRQDKVVSDALGLVRADIQEISRKIDRFNERAMDRDGARR